MLKTKFKNPERASETYRALAVKYALTPWDTFTFCKREKNSDEFTVKNCKVYERINHHEVCQQIEEREESATRELLIKDHSERDYKITVTK